jgi:lysozyme family protein
MPSAAFEAALPFVLRWEGGFVDHPNDPGGRTNQGVTQKVYDDWRRRQGCLSATSS